MLKLAIIHPSPQHLRQVLGPQMSIAFQHLQSLVTGDGRYLHGVQALLKEAAGGLMPEIVKAQVLNGGAFADAVEGLCDAICPNTPHFTIHATGQGIQHG